MLAAALTGAAVGCTSEPRPEATTSSGGGDSSAQTEAEGRSTTRPAQHRRSQKRRRDRNPPGPPQNARPDTVASVTDGDTIVLSSLGKTRLIGVDTPEVYGGAECYGREASRFTREQLPVGAAVQYVRGVEATDRYGRALAYVWTEGRFFNARLVQRGYAVPLTIPPNVDHAELFRKLARSARAADRGLWATATCAGDDDRPAWDGGGSSPTPAPKPKPTRVGSTGGGGGDKDCADFTSHSAAQDFFEENGGPGSDPHRLDADGDGQACESLP